MFVDVALVALSLFPLAWTGYLAALALLSWEAEVPASDGSEKTRFDVIGPAHDEELGIAATAESLLADDYPADLRRVLVVPDNCGDAAAARSREAGCVRPA